jgi:hypothetical protein
MARALAILLLLASAAVAVGVGNTLLTEWNLRKKDRGRERKEDESQWLPLSHATLPSEDAVSAVYAVRPSVGERSHGCAG